MCHGHMRADPPKRFTSSCLGNLAAGEATVATGFKVSQVRLNRQVRVDLRGHEGGVALPRGQFQLMTISILGRPGVNNHAGGLDGAGRD